MIREIEPGWWKGEFILIEDKGNLSTGSKTRVFKVTSNGQLLGNVKWCGPWRKYAFYTNNIILDEGCMVDLISFMTERSAEHKEGWKKQSIIDWELVKSFEEKNDF